MYEDKIVRLPIDQRRKDTPAQRNKVTPPRRKPYKSGPQRRQKTFVVCGTPLENYLKAATINQVAQWNIAHRKPGKNKGPVTPDFWSVLNSMLYHFHNAKTGECFPAHSAVAVNAGCSVSTVRRALKLFEEAGFLTWRHRLIRETTRVRDGLTNRWKGATRVIRTSNSYQFIVRSLSAAETAVAKRTAAMKAAASAVGRAWNAASESTENRQISIAANQSVQNERGTRRIKTQEIPDSEQRENSAKSASVDNHSARPSALDMALGRLRGLVMGNDDPQIA